MKTKLLFFLILILGFLSCGKEDYTPKPKGYLRLDYPKVSYQMQQLPNIPLAFEISSLIDDVKVIPLKSTTEGYGINLEYTSLKATVFLTYRAIENNEQNLNAFLRDAQKLTLEHTKKADEIPRYPYENYKLKVYGMLSEVKGNAASPVQFYVTDSTQHFLTGSLYFKTKPNYDSILPAASYLKKDIQRIMESIKWQNNANFTTYEKIDLDANNQLSK
ncbi:gliding motility lipoprotein GldD [Hyunsoonleella pacifica]|uniref:Gliding motility lipoprotein GldD n=1 Tax=Hyunsoonleella pacifica TaxID=1080224 RepID=A0A4Q9FNF6_9FLAO|nr:gliding motility lipoprotein GldD [Hyunsoonleella pacifica]TBN15781.1 gliding motility lipoprotein GldD [Hyunsoonleella pacifica]GGD22594.1 gliding motility lipoprotein GldD [Hyunsoonleella pacifica]